MNAEEQLRERLAQAGDQLPEPPDRFNEVVRRGRRRTWIQRGAAAGAVAALLLTAPFVLRGPDRTQVDLEPARPGPEPTPADTTEPPGDALSLAELGAPVLAWGPYDHDQLTIVDRKGEERLGVPVDAAYPDGRGGAVFQPAASSEIRWTGAREPLVAVDGELILRGLLPGDRVLYSVRHGEGEDSTEDFFTVELAEGAEPAHLTSTGVLERSIVGPAVAADRRLVHASCHIHCSLWVGLAESEDDEPLYRGLTIDGLTATPDGAVLGFVEYDLVVQAAPELVLLDGTTFDELARIGLPGAGEQRMGVPVVSLSADGQRALVTLGGGAVPWDPYLVEDALGDATVSPIAFWGAVRWADGP